MLHGISDCGWWEENSMLHGISDCGWWEGTACYMVYLTVGGGRRTVGYMGISDC